MIFTWTLNILLLAVLTVSYSKRSRVEALYALRKGAPVQGIVVEDTAEGEAPMPPLYYCGCWHATIVPWTDPAADLAMELACYDGDERPDVVLFIGLEEFDTRWERAQAAMGPLEELGRAEPGLVDRVVHWLNPVNRNETIVIARTTSPIARP